MNNISYIKSIKRNWQVVALLAGIAVVIALIVSLMQPFQYQASTKMLVIQHQVGSLDAYTATKSAEKIGRNLAQVVNTSVFYQDALKLNPSIADMFNQTDEFERRELWEKNVEVNIVPETGILEVKAYDENKVQAAELVQTIASVMLINADEFHGGGEQVEIKVIDDVFVGKYPVRPNIALNVGFAVIAGFVIASIFLVLNEARRLSKEMKQVSIFDEEISDQPVIVEPQRAINLTPIAEVERSFDQPKEDEHERAMHGWRIVEENL